MVQRFLFGFRGPKIDFLLFLYAAILIFASIFPRLGDSQHFGVSVSADPWIMSKSFGYADAGSYLKSGLQLTVENRILENYFWILNLWPPGMPVLDAALVRIFGDNYGIALGFVIAILWSSVLFQYIVHTLGVRFKDVSEHSSQALSYD